MVAAIVLVVVIDALIIGGIVWQYHLALAR
jgi:hypothetical protein